MSTKKGKLNDNSEVNCALINKKNHCKTSYEISKNLEYFQKLFSIFTTSFRCITEMHIEQTQYKEHRHSTTSYLSSITVYSTTLRNSKIK